MMVVTVVMTVMIMMLMIMLSLLTWSKYTFHWVTKLLD